MNRFFFLALLALTLMLIAPFAAFADLAVSTGGEKGTYHAMFKSIQAVCGDKVPLTEQLSSGSDENLDRLVQNQATLAIVQTDALQFQAMNDPRVSDERIRTLVVLHPEEVHIIVKANLSVGGNMIGWGGRAPQTLQDLQGKKVGVWGGSHTTVMVMNTQGQLGMNVMRFNDAKAALEAFAKDAVDALIAVGGQPLGFVADLDQRFRLLSVGDTAKFSFYVPAKLNYRKLNAQGVPTIAAQALLVTRNLKTPEKRAELLALRKCILANLGEFQEGSGHHPKWQDVDPKAQSVRVFYGTETRK